MSTERTDQGPLSDAVVSQIYRESATERAPEELDAKILRDARAHVGARYLRTIGWLRPMAWAATIGLSLAIVLELSNPPSPETGAIEVPIEAPIELPEVDAVQAPIAVPVAAEPEARNEEAAKPPAALPASSDNSEQRDTAVNVDAFRVSDAPLLEEAADMARMRDGPNQVANSAVSGATASSVESVAACEASRTVNPETWLSCIDELDAAGRNDDAKLERERLLRTFPDFEMP